MSGPRPAAMTSHSASPAVSPYLKVQLADPDSMSVTSVPVWTVIPWRLNPRSASLEMSASSVGSTRSSASNSVTSTPRRA